MGQIANKLFADMIVNITRKIKSNKAAKKTDKPADNQKGSGKSR